MLPSPLFKAVRLCVAGNINRDIKTALFLGGKSLFSDGEMGVKAIHETIGGGGANSAAIAARLGARSFFVGQVGDDLFGRRLERAMKKSGVSCSLNRNAEVSTGTTINLVFDSGHRHFLSCHPNNAIFRFEHLNLKLLPQADHFLRADIWFSEPMLYGGNEKLFHHVHKLGIPISIDLNWDPQWGHSGKSEVRRRKQAIRKLLPWVVLAHGNIRELNKFAGTDNLETSLWRIIEWGAEAVVVHMGSEGAGYYWKGELFVEPPVFVRQPKIVTGTGDVLSVCMMLLHRHENKSIREQLRVANRVVASFMGGKLNLIPEL